MIEERLTIGLVVERRVLTGAWGGYAWAPVAILPPTPDVAPWTPLGGTPDRMHYFAGCVDIHLYSTDTANYRDNLEAAEPKLWVVLRPDGPEPPAGVLLVTADPAEGEASTEAGANVVETIAMLAGVAGVIAAFIAEHHVERPVLKRRRDRPDASGHLEAEARRAEPDVRWRRPPGDDTGGGTSGGGKE